MTGIVFILLLLLAIAVITDTSDSRIPNSLILIGLAAGIWTTNHLSKSISICIFSILIFFPLFLVGALGAGDIKCLAMMSFYLLPEQLLMAMFYTFLLAALLSIFKMLKIGSFSKKLKIQLALPMFFGVLISVGGTYL